MKARLVAFVMSAVLVATVGMAPAFGQIQDSVVVMTDKESYATGETIIVSGEVRQKLGFGLTIQIIAENGNRVATGQPTIGDDRTFSHEFVAGGNVMKFTGTYTVSVQYGDSDSRSAETTFEFTGGEAPVTPPTEDPPITDTTIRVEGATDLITYEITGGTVTSVSPNVEAMSLILTIEATDDGMITLTVPRSVLDAVTDGVDESFFVLVDGSEAEFEETDVTDTHRTLTIQFPAATEEIEIIGTFVIPEFGVIAVLILAVAIISVVAISSRSRLGIVMPRY